MTVRTANMHATLAGGVTTKHRAILHNGDPRAMARRRQRRDQPGHPTPYDTEIDLMDRFRKTIIAYSHSDPP
jgi:hypothetical protein